MKTKYRFSKSAMDCLVMVVVLMLPCCQSLFAQKKTVREKDSVVYHITYRDTTVYRYDTVLIKHYVHSDTLWTPVVNRAGPLLPVKKRTINPNNFGIGPSIGAWYSPYNGFDFNFGFSIQYYILSIPSLKKPHTGRKGHRR